MLYVQSMHIFNNLIGTKADRYNDPDRSFFYQKNKILLSLLAFTAGGVGLTIAYSMGTIPFLILLGMSIMGLSYNLRLIPEHFTCSKYRRIRDVPGSKTVLIAMAWGIVTSVLPSYVRIREYSSEYDHHILVVFESGLCQDRIFRCS